MMGAVGVSSQEEGVRNVSGTLLWFQMLLPGMCLQLYTNCMWPRVMDGATVYGWRGLIEGSSIHSGIGKSSSTQGEDF